MKITKQRLKQIIIEEIEKTTVTQIAPSKADISEMYTAKIAPLDFLKLVTPQKEFPFYNNFLKEIKKQKIKTIDDAKKYVSSLTEKDPTAQQNIAKLVVIKSLSNDFNPSGTPSLSMVLGAVPYVIEHEGRSRMFLRLLNNFLNKNVQQKEEINIVIDKSKSFFNFEWYKANHSDVTVNGQKRMQGGAIKLTEIEDIKPA